LRKKIDLNSGKSTKKLACAALVRALLWADELDDLDSTDSDEEILLATMIGFESRFMAELAQACCGLIQSIPPHLAEEIMSSLGSSNIISFDSSLINSMSSIDSKI
jgi:leucyl-tRNA synthetase